MQNETDGGKSSTSFYRCIFTMERFLTGLSWDGESPEVLWNEWLDWKLFNWLLLLLRGWSFLEYQRVRRCQNVIPCMLAIRKPLLIKFWNKFVSCPKRDEMNFLVLESYNKVQLCLEELNRKKFKAHDQGLRFARVLIRLGRSRKECKNTKTAAQHSDGQSARAC